MPHSDTSSEKSSSTHLDVLIIGAGISGINTAYRLQTQCPWASYAILESRAQMGGTWDLFKYPGIRSDSDLYTYGFPWRIWKNTDKTIAEAGLIMDYLKDSAREIGVEGKIKYQHSLLSANWSNKEQMWTCVVAAEGEKMVFTTGWLCLCTGYFDYHRALPAVIPGIEDFQGKVVHPQFWPEDLDFADKKVVVIGSGATAVTLIPNLAKEAKQVTMLQRSPGYVLSISQKDKTASWLERFLPRRLAETMIWFKWVLGPWIIFRWCRNFPNAARKVLRGQSRKQLPKDVPIDPHFNPRYNPWEQRLCISPSGDFYKALRKGNADIVTGKIKQVTADSIILEDSHEVLKPDIIVTATGLKMQLAGGAKLSIDGEEVDYSKKHLWKGALLEDVPNATLFMGYAYQSWTLGIDVTAQQVTRLLHYLRKKGYTSVRPKLEPETRSKMKDMPFMPLTSTYLTNAEGSIAKAGSMWPWTPRKNYWVDWWDARFGGFKSLQFDRNGR